MAAQKVIVYFSARAANAAVNDPHQQQENWVGSIFACHQEVAGTIPVLRAGDLVEFIEGG